MEAVASAAVVEVYKDGRALVSKMTRSIDYASELKKNHKRLTEIVEKLNAQKERMEAETNNKYQTKQFTKKCKFWISSVMESRKKVLELKTMFEKERSKNVLRKLLRCSRGELSECMVDMCKELDSLCREGHEIGLLVEELPERVNTPRTPRIEDKPSPHDGCVKEILGHLSDKNIRRIGLWGLTGTGKTTIMQILNNNNDIAKMFDIVISVTVPNDGSVDKLQRAITNRLKLNVEGITDLHEIASQISLELECKRCLLLLDNVCENLNLDMIPIPNKQKDSKVVLASRKREVYRQMDVDEFIKVKTMSPIDAWKMFMKIVGPKVNRPRIKQTAEKIVRECHGFPLLIDKVANTLKTKENIYIWNDMLTSLQIWSGINIQGINELTEILKSCYKELEGEDKKNCFLFCALFPEDYEIHIEYLLECWIVEGFIKDVNDFRDARGRGHTILSELIGSSLLDEGEKMNHVRMNKVLRNMAIQICSQSENLKILVKAGEGLEKPPNALEWHQVFRISLMDNKLLTLPDLSVCSNLSTLLLQRNHDLGVIPDTFFECIPNLRVLDLHNTGIESLPSSISCLTCLKSLYLNFCIRLTDLCYLEKLEHLEVLDIRGIGINHIPKQIRSLVQLKCLRMSLPDLGTGFHLNGFSIPSLLEELRIDLDRPNQRLAVVEGIVQEVATLTRLTSLSICFPNLDYLEHFILTSPSWNNHCFQFQFCVGYPDLNSYKMFDQSKYPRYFVFANGEGVNTTISKVLGESDIFELINHKGASSLSTFGYESIDKIGVCLIKGCNEIETIVNGNTVGSNALEWLEIMDINNVPKLESIWEGHIHAKSLKRLATLTLQRCPKLKKIFSDGMIEQLSELEYLNVEECHEIEEIITKSGNRGLEPEALPKLKTLVLSDLPRVKSICTEESLKWLSLKKIKISMCQLLTTLPFNNENAINLGCIETHQSWWSALVWRDNAIEQRLQPMCIFS